MIAVTAFENKYVDVVGFPVHESVLVTLDAWRPEYWTQLTSDVRRDIDIQTLKFFGHSLADKQYCLEPEYSDKYRQLEIHRSASSAHRFFWMTCQRALADRHQAIIDLKRVPCGARKKSGKQCKALAEPGRNRCRFHGGLSTGPKTIDGKIKSLSQLSQYRWKPHLLIEKRRELEEEMRRETGMQDLNVKPELSD